MPEISNKVVLPILGVVALVILSYFLNQMFGSFGQLNYLTMDHCEYQGERMLSMVQRTSASHTADDAWNASGRTIVTLTPDGNACDATLPKADGAGGDPASIAYYTPQGQTFTHSGAAISAAALPTTFKGVQTLAIMQSNAGILQLLIQALPLLAAIGILTAGYMWYKGGFGAAKVSE